MSQANKRAGEQSVGGAPMSVRNGSAAPRRPFSGVICGVTGRGVDALVRRAERTARSATHAVRTGRARRAASSDAAGSSHWCPHAAEAGCGGVGLVVWDLQAATPLCSLHGPWAFLRRKLHPVCRGGAGTVGASKKAPIGSQVWHAVWAETERYSLGLRLSDAAVSLPHARGCMHAPSIRQHSSPRERCSAPCPLGLEHWQLPSPISVH